MLSQASYYCKERRVLLHHYSVYAFRFKCYQKLATGNTCHILHLHPTPSPMRKHSSFLPPTAEPPRNTNLKKYLFWPPPINLTSSIHSWPVLHQIWNPSTSSNSIFYLECAEKSKLDRTDLFFLVSICSRHILVELLAIFMLCYVCGSVSNLMVCCQRKHRAIYIMMHTKQITRSQETLWRAHILYHWITTRSKITQANLTHHWTQEEKWLSSTIPSLMLCATLQNRSN